MFSPKLTEPMEKKTCSKMFRAKEPNGEGVFHFCPPFIVPLVHNEILSDSIYISIFNV